MISINSRGDFCHGVGGGYFNVNNVQIRPGGSGGWIDDDFAALADGTDGWKVAVYYMPTGRVTRGHPEYPNGVVTTDIKAGGGVYASWPGVGGVLASTGWTYPDSGLLGVGPDGAIAYKPSYQSGGPSLVRERDGSEWQLTPNHPYDLQLLGQRRALWNDTVLGFTVLGIPMPQRLPGNNWFPHAFLLEDQWWFGCQNESCGVVAHPFDNPHRGYVIVPTGNAWPAFRALDRYTLLCVWSNSEAEQAGQLTPRRFDVRTDPLVDIVVPKPPIPHADAPHADAPPPVLVAPKVAVLAWDPLIKAGVPWHVKFKTGAKDTVDVSKDAQDHLVIAAWNDAGTDTTGTVRQLTVEGADTPDPPIPPEPQMPLGRFWLQPNIGSLDLAQILDDPSRLDHVDVFVIPVQLILTDETTDQVGPNTYPNLVAAGFFAKLKATGVPLVVEMGSIKPYDCLAQNGIADMQKAVQRVTEAGGVIAAFSADEPLTANQWPVERGGCHQSLEACADAHAAWTHAIRDLNLGILVGYLEAWPEVALADIETFFHLLLPRKALPDYFHADTDWVRAENERKDPAKFLHAAQALSDQFGIVFGSFVNSTVDPIPTDPEHHQNLLDLAARIQTIEPAVAHVCVAAWATRDGTLATQNVPNNLGAAGLLDTFGQVRARFEETPPPEPPDPGGDMLYATLIEPTKDRGPVVVKEKKPVKGEPGVFTLILPDDRVFSMIPTGDDGDQVPGTEGPYEKCTVSGNAATFRPEPDKVFTRFFALVAGL